jgi:hypothetical protein
MNSHWMTTTVTPEQLHSFQSLWKSLIEWSQIVFIGCSPLSDWLDSLIGPGGLLLLVLHLFAVAVFMTFMDVVG